MPLSASHIKFALDLKDYFKPKDLKKYFEGAIYPDSRYLSGINREKTHSEDFWLKSFWHNDDFKKGWASHNISDRAYVNGIRKIFPSWIDLNDENVKIENAAVKIIGDISLLDDEVLQVIKSIDRVSGMNEEKEEVMAEHFETIKNCYKNGRETKISDYIDTMRKSVGKEVIEKAELLNKDKKLSSVIKNFFKEGVKKEINKLLK